MSAAKSERSADGWLPQESQTVELSGAICTGSLSFDNAPEPADVEAASKVIRQVMESAAEPMVTLSVPLGVEIGTGPSWGAAH